MLLADLNGLDISGYVRRILQAVADNQKDLIDKARDLNSRFSAEKSKLATDDFNFLAKQALAQDAKADKRFLVKTSKEYARNKVKAEKN